MKRFLRYDYRAYLICLATAACFWLLNAMGGQYESDILYPVRFVPDSVSVSVLQPLKANVVFNASGTGWELLKRSLFYRFSPNEIYLSSVRKSGVLVAEDLQQYIRPHLGQLKINYLKTDSIVVSKQMVLQKKVYLKINPDKLKFIPSYRVSGKIYLEPDYITVSGPYQAVLNTPDTLNLKINRVVSTGIDTLMDLRRTLSEQLILDHDKAHLIFDIAPFEKKEKKIKAVLVDFPDSVKTAFTIPEFKITYFVQRDYAELEKKARYKIILDYNMRDIHTNTLVPVLVEHPEYIHQYKISPAVFSLKKNGK